MSQPTALSSDEVAKIKELRAVFRSDLHVSRQMDQGQPVYVVHDPIVFQTHQLDLQQYKIAASLDGQRSLADVFWQLVQDDRLKDSDEVFFYEFVAQLYQAGLTTLPIHNGAAFYDRFQRLQMLKRKNRWLSLLFLRIPLANPDGFLSRTEPYVRWMFSRWFFLLWLVAGLLSVMLLMVRFQDFVKPVHGILAPGNLPTLWLTFIALKLWHELGHGYACKVFSTRVPEMGTILIVGNPLAYVDATAAWSLPERWKRLVVMCGGIYFESIVAIPAIFVWATFTESVLGTIAYQVTLTASLVTLLFNANPLMKFDGYFILSELLGLSNLRSRATHQLRQLFKRVLLRMPADESPEPLRTRGVLLLYGIASSAYRVFLVLTISLFIATTFPMVGILVAVYYLSTSIFRAAIKAGRYLLTAEETACIRLRCQVIASLVVLGIPTALILIPVPFDVVTQGIVAAETEHVVRIDTPGEFDHAGVAPGKWIGHNTPLVLLSNDRVTHELRVTEALLQEAELKWKVARNEDVVQSSRIEAEIQALEEQLGEWKRRQRNLLVVAPANGYVLRILADSQQGRFLNTGDPVAIVADGSPVLRVWLNQDQLNRIVQQPGTSVKFRVPGRSETTHRGRLNKIEPAAESDFNEQALTILGGGDLIIDPQTGRPLEALFQAEIVPDSDVLSLDCHGNRIAVALPRRYESIGSWATRTCSRFLRQLLLA